MSVPTSLPRRARRILAASTIAAFAAGFGACDEGLHLEPGEQYGGGEATTNRVQFGREAFAQPLPNLSSDRRSVFFTGNSFFNQVWVTAPSSTSGRDGLGPTMNAVSCSACHFKDGRGRPPIDGETRMTSMLVRLSIPGADAHGGPLDEPTYGGQFQTLAIDGVPPEGNAMLSYVELPGTYDDGTPYSLREPTVVIENLQFGPMMPTTMFSARVAPTMIGLGALEFLPEDVLVARADPDDLDGDGISGRANRVWDASAGVMALGRFGWKAGQPTIRDQVAGAFNGDMGITSPVALDQNCPAPQVACAAAPSGALPGEPEIEETSLSFVVLYSRTLAVPMRTNADDPEVLHGRELFRELGCPSCHVESYVMPTGVGLPELEGQTIRPFTDLLLHDMGEGLSDGRPEFDASGTEWRTPPLWGLGRVEGVNGHTFLLHDGRARGFAEAILWHGGEASEARDAFRALSARDRDRLVAYLSSL